jgi:hypothetical protein
MNRILRCCIPMLCVALVSICSAGAQSAPPAEAPQGARRPPSPPKNLKVLPADTDLRKVMRQYSGALGVDCEFCHAPEDPVTHRGDRASDANPMKDRARYMIRMTQDLNTKYLAQFPDRQGHGDDEISCGTCHRGEKHPPEFVPAPRQEGNRPPTPPPAAPGY